MKQFGIAVIMLLGLTLIGCGSSSSNSSNINGNWNATLVGSNNTTMFQFGTSFTANGDGSVTVSNFNFTSNSSCFANGATETGSFGVAGDFNGNTNGTFGMTVQSTSPSGNTLTLAGTDKGNTISGTWTLAGSTGCTGSGTFTMSKM